VGQIDRHAFGLLRDAGIAGRAIELRDQRRSGDLPGERVLASARAEKQDVHGADVAGFAAHDPEKWAPVFGSDHAQAKNYGTTIAAFVPAGSGVGSTSTTPLASRTR